jgi:hypothetical protein
MPAVFKPHKRKRVKPGKQLQSLYDQVYERDEGICVACGDYVEHGAPAHHVKRGKDKEDRIEFMVTACPPGTTNNCHDKTDGEERPELEYKFYMHLRREHPEFYKLYDRAQNCPDADTDVCFDCVNDLCNYSRGF